MPETSSVKKIYKWKTFTGRPVGRPKSGWEDGVRNDLEKDETHTMDRSVKDRLKWKDIDEKAKTLPELQRHRRRILQITCGNFPGQTGEAYDKSQNAPSPGPV
jgi:hypothetical protein